MYIYVCIHICIYIQSGWTPFCVVGSSDTAIAGLILTRSWSPCAPPPRRRLPGIPLRSSR